MRRLTGALAGRLGEERGAIAVFVALAMVVLVAFAALAIDTAAIRRDQQVLRNSADAAALAVALECAQQDAPDASADLDGLGSTPAPGDEETGGEDLSTSTAQDSCPTGPEVDEISAGLVSANGGGYDVTTLSVAERSVSVTTSTQPDGLISQMFGFEPGEVSVTSTAVWAPQTHGFSASYPLALSYCRLADLAAQQVTTIGTLPILPPRQEITPADWTGNDTCQGPDGGQLIAPISVMTPTDDGQECGTTSAKGREVTGETWEGTAFAARTCVASGQFGGPDSWTYGGYDIVLPVYDQVSGDRYRVWDFLRFHVMGVTDRGGLWGFSRGLADRGSAVAVPASVRLVADP